MPQQYCGCFVCRGACMACASEPDAHRSQPLTTTASSSGSGSARGCTDSANCMPLLLSMSVLTGTTLSVLRSSLGLALPVSRTMKRLRLLGGCTWAPFTRVSNTCTPSNNREAVDEMPLARTSTMHAHKTHKHHHNPLADHHNGGSKQLHH
jgi:hypothetical protein